MTEDDRHSRRPRRITAADVAAKAEVSRSAVSRAFTPNAYLDKEKRRRILQAALELGYRPNALAASLQGGQSDLVGLVVGAMTNPYDSCWMAAMVDRLNAAGKWPVALGGVGEQTDDFALSLLRFPLDALIVRGGSVGASVIESCLKLNIPVILSGRVVEAEFVDCVSCRNRTGMAQAAEMLLAGGRRRIAYVGGPGSYSSDRERLAGLTEALARAGCTIHAHVTSDFSVDGGARAMQSLLAAAPDHRPDAVMCGNDAMALGAISYARHSAGLRVPEDIALVGFDDIPMSGWPEFNLTTLSNPIDRTADELMRLLIARLRDPYRAAETVWVEPDLVLRGTH